MDWGCLCRFRALAVLSEPLGVSVLRSCIYKTRIRILASSFWQGGGRSLGPTWERPELLRGEAGTTGQRPALAGNRPCGCIRSHVVFSLLWPQAGGGRLAFPLGLCGVDSGTFAQHPFP